MLRQPWTWRAAIAEDMAHNSRDGSEDKGDDSTAAKQQEKDVWMERQTYYPSLAIVPYATDMAVGKWGRLGVELGANLDKFPKTAQSAEFPTGWSMRSVSEDARRGVYFDPSGIAKVVVLLDWIKPSLNRTVFLEHTGDATLFAAQETKEVSDWRTTLDQFAPGSSYCHVGRGRDDSPGGFDLQRRGHGL